MSREGHEDMAVEGDEIEEDIESESDIGRRSSPLDLRRGDEVPRQRNDRFPFSISSLLERREEVDAREMLGAESDSAEESDGHRGSRDPQRLSGEESDGGEDEDGNEASVRPFQPYTFTHTPFVGGILPHLGLFPPISAAAAVAAAGINSQSPLMSMAGPGGVIRVPAHRPSVGNGPHAALTGILPQMTNPLPWLTGLTPLERTAAVAHHLSALAPLAGTSS